MWFCFICLFASVVSSSICFIIHLTCLFSLLKRFVIFVFMYSVVLAFVGWAFPSDIYAFVYIIGRICVMCDIFICDTDVSVVLLSLSFSFLRVVLHHVSISLVVVCLSSGLIFCGV